MGESKGKKNMAKSVFSAEKRGPRFKSMKQDE
jgi:hypothetical protein